MPNLTKVPLYEKYEPIEWFEVLYWRGVQEKWRWNSYAADLIKYAQEHLPLQKIRFIGYYNSSRQDPEYSFNARRIEALRFQKLRRFPLVCINGNRGGSAEFEIINSSYAYNQMIERIDAEWNRYYGLV